VVTGGEALYADLGHFALAPIRRAWFLIVFPALVLNYRRAMLPSFAHGSRCSLTSVAL